MNSGGAAASGCSPRQPVHLSIVRRHRSQLLGVFPTDVFLGGQDRPKRQLEIGSPRSVAATATRHVTTLRDADRRTLSERSELCDRLLVAGEDLL